MKSILKSAAGACFGLLTLVSTAFATPIQWISGTGANGHYYELVSTAPTISWTDASAAATGKGGYLVTLTSGNENLWVTNNILSAVSSDIHAWIGLYQQTGSVEPAGGWKWVTGETFAYTNWNTSEPNNQGGSENFAHFNGGATNAAGRRWNDIPATALFSYYVVEYNSNPVPEAASTLLLLGAGLSLLLRVRPREA